MKITLFGGNGMIGQRILNEAIARGHAVTVVGRNPGQAGEGFAVAAGDVLDPASVASLVAGQDAVISAIGPGSSDPQQIVKAAHSLIAGLTQAGVRHLLVVGGAGSLEVAPGLQLVDTPQFPEAWKGLALAHRDALAVYKEADLDWTFFSPAALIQPGERTGQFQRGTTQFLTDTQGQSAISCEDFAVAMLNELEQPSGEHQVTVAY